jgi:flagellar protein FlaG
MALGPIDSRASVVLPQTDRPVAMPRNPVGQGTPSDRAGVANANLSEQVRASQEQARREDVESAVKKVNHVIQASARDIEFTVDDSSGETVIKVIDRSTKELIRQIPSKEMLAIAQSIDRLQGLLVKQQV